MRVFIAIDCNDVHTNFLDIQKNLPQHKTKLTNSFHITLKFLGEVTEKEIEYIQTQLEQISKKPFNLSVDHIGVFSDNEYLKIIWAGFKDKHNIITLQKRIDETLLPFRKIQKRYLPHITLARIKKQIKNTTKNKKMLKKGFQMNSFAATRFEIEPFTLQIKEFQLIQSTITTNGPVYTILKTFQLK